jgi:hypothetical protein
MRRAVLILIALGALVAPAADAVPVRRVDAGHGLAVVLPHGWRISHTRVTTCSSPADRFVAVFGRARLHTGMNAPAGAALVLVQEAWGPFPKRPKAFALPRLIANLGGCCEMPMGRGTELLFRDHGRSFYAFIYIGKHAPSEATRDVVALLDSLRVSRAEGAAAA